MFKNIWKKEPTTSKAKLSKFDQGCAELLFSTITKHNAIAQPYSLREWGKAFYQLRKVDKVPEEKIKKVLQWYCDNFGEPYIPIATSGYWFRKKFDRIQLAMANVPSKNVILGDAEKNLLARLQGKNWPGSVVNQLPGIIQMSYEFIRDFNRKRKYLAINPPPNITNIYFKFFIIHMSKIDFHPGFQVELYLDKMNDKVNYHPDTRIKPLSMQNPYFQAMGYNWAVDWHHRPQLWDQYKQLLEEVPDVGT